MPEIFEGRNFYIHNPQVTLMRTNAAECSQIGEVIAAKANANSAPVAILNPLKAVSEINGEGQAFYDPEADTALFEAIRSNAKVEVIDLDEPINSLNLLKLASFSNSSPRPQPKGPRLSWETVPSKFHFFHRLPGQPSTIRLQRRFDNH